MESVHRRSIAGRSVLWPLVSVCLLLTACSVRGGGSQTLAGTAGFHTTVKTADQQFVIQFDLTPNVIGLNTFTVGVEDAADDKSVSRLQVHLATTMPEMDMTGEVSLSPDGPGQYRGQGTLSMAGNLEIQIDFHSPDAVLRQANVTLDVAP